MFRFKDKGGDARKKPGDESTQLLVAPGTEITYKPELIGKYQQDHSNLQELFNEVLAALQLQDSGQFVRKLRDLQIGLRRHLLDEELNLYIYLRHCYTQDKLRQELINQFKRRSKKVGVETFAYIGKVTEEGYNITTSELFLSELLAVGNMLDNLLEAEETHLYPIYKRP